MAIELVPQLTTGAPSAGSADWDKMIGLVSANEVPDLSFLTGWGLTAGIPAIKQGVYIYHAGATYRVNNSDEAISGTPVTGINYIEATVSAGVMTLAWVTSKTGYSYNAAYGGIYNAGDVNQLLPDVLYITGSNYLRGRCFGMGFEFIHLSDGNFIMTSGINTLGTDINLGAGDLISDKLDTSNSIFIPSYKYVKNRFNTNNSDLRFITTDGTNLISYKFVDAFGGVIYIHTEVSGTHTTSFSTAYNYFAMTCDGTNLITAYLSGGTRYIKIHSGLTDTASSTFTVPNISSLAYDGTNLIRGYSNTIYIHSGVTSTVSSSFSTIINPTKMCYDGENILIMNGIDQMAVYKTDGTLLYYSPYVFADLEDIVYINDSIVLAASTTADYRERALTT